MSSYRSRSNDGDVAARLLGSILAVGLGPLAMFLIWGPLHLFAGGTRYPYSFDRWAQNTWVPEGWNLLGATPWMWLYIIVVLIILAVIWGVDGTPGTRAISTVLAIAAVVSFIPVFDGMVSSDKVKGQFYGRNTEFYVPDLNKVPSPLARLAEGGARVENDGKVTEIKSHHDVHGIIKQGALPDSPGLWTGRTASYHGALTVLSSQTSNQQGADLLEDSLTYLNGEKEENGIWTGVIDGSGNYTAAKGVVSWNAKTGKVTKCLFDGDYEFNRSFGGAKHNSLSHWILSKYTGMFYADSDIWGYCEGNKPVFVVPMKTRTPYHHQNFEVPAGVLIVKGSKSGDPQLDLRTEVKKSQLAGPVIPASILTHQRDALDWAAGRKYRSNKYGNGGFGFDVASVESQLGNDADFRLFNTGDQTWYYLTPLTPNNPKSQTYTAYMAVATDTVKAGVLPLVKVFVPADGTTAPNADQLLSQALTYLGNERPGFTTARGELRELVPQGGDMWRIYGEVKGYTTDYIEMSATGRVTPKVVTLGGSAPGLALPGLPAQAPGTKPPADPCIKGQKEMNSAEKAACIKALVDDLAKRQQAPR